MPTGSTEHFEGQFDCVQPYILPQISNIEMIEPFQGQRFHTFSP